MEMHQVRYFIAAARLLNFTRAALECNVSQPALTKAILKLEEEFGGPLFRRERARTHLTELGKAMLPHLQRTFDAAQAARQLARDMERATVAPLSIGISRIVSDELFAPIFRDLQASLAGVELAVTAGSDRELVDLAMAGSLDVVVLALPPDAPERFERWLLFGDEFRIVVPADHGLAQAQAVTPAELEAEVWIDLAGDGCETLSRYAASGGAAIAVRHQAQHPGMVRQLVLGGLGCGWLPGGIVPAPLVAVPAVVPDSGIEIVIASVAGRRRALAADVFLRACRAHRWVSPGAERSDIAPGYRTDDPGTPSADLRPG